MLQFFKYVLATIIGIFLFCLLSFLLMLGIGAAFSSGDKTASVKTKSVLKLNLNKNIVESVSSEEDPFEAMFNNSGPGNIGLVQIKEALKNAALDDNIKGIYLKSEYPLAAFSTIKDIRDALLEFKKSDKFIYSYGEIASEKAIYLNSVADKIYLNPTGGLEFNGLHGETMFLKNMLDKIGVEPLIFKVGTYKSAIEPLIRTNMSEPNKEQVSSYLNSIANTIYSEIATSRGISLAEINSILNEAKIQNTTDAVTHKIITNVGYYDEFESELRKTLGEDEDDKINFVSLKKYLKAPKLVKAGSRSNRIAVIMSSGSINSGKADNDQSIGSETFVKELRKAVKDDKVKAIVLRINSPGGSALASDVMWREIQLAKAKKPIIASMGDYAASGGYYMAMGADSIVANPTTITGSIGIFGVMFNAQNLLNNKLGLTFDGVQTHKYANSPSATRKMSEAEKMMIQNSVNDGYKKFTTKAAQGRNMNIEDLEKIASGRVWTGKQALENGLVDALGNLDDAVAMAAKKVNLDAEDYQVKYYPQPKTQFEQIISQINNNSDDAKLKQVFGLFAPVAKELNELQKMEKLQTKLPYTLDIK